MSFDNNSFYDDNSTKNWQPQPTPMEDRRRRHTGRWITAIVILALLVLTGIGTVHLVRDVGVTLNRSDSGFLLTIGREQPAESADVQTADPQPAAQEQTAAAEGPAPAAQAPVQAQAQAELPQLEISSSPAGVPTSASEDAGALSLQEIYRRCSGSVVSIISVTQSGKASGTGIIMSADGYIITNHHVIENAQAVSVLTNDDKEYTTSIVGSDETSDLAVLKIEASGLQAAEFGDSSVLQVGDSVVAIGDPLGVTLRGTMTDGIISAINRDLTVNDRTMNLIQTNAALNNGNSGGPLINCYGQVIGINTMKIGAFTDTAGVEGLGFAIPSTQVKEIVDQIIAQGYVSGRPTLGITGEALSTFYQHYYRMPAGLYITEVDPGSDAASKGIQEGDMLLYLDDTRIVSADDLKTAIYEYEVGEVVEVIIYSRGQQYRMELTLGEDVPNYG